jgi:hypothetical protein
MDKNSISLATLGLSILACALAVLALTRGSHAPVTVGASDSSDSKRLQELTDQTVALRADLNRFASASRDTSALREPMERAPEQATVPPELLQRLAGLEESVTALQRQSKQRAARIGPAHIEPIDLAEAQRRATDPRSNEEQKLAALKALRGQKLGGQDAISGDVVLSMIDLAEPRAPSVRRARAPPLADQAPSSSPSASVAR